MAHILIADDEPKIRAVIREYAEFEGHTVTEAADGMQAIECVRQEDFDVAVVDIMMPRLDGYSACKEIRKLKDIPIIMLSARGEEYDKLFGFEIGIDDYMVKPFSPKELLARINALLRRISLADKQVEEENNAIHSGIFTILQDERKLLKNGQEIELTPIEFALVKYFMENPNKAIHRDEILNNVWGYNYVGDFKIVDVNIRRIRQKIEEDPSNPKYIEKVWGYGYRWWGGEE